jgi:hypothetical protein
MNVERIAAENVLNPPAQTRANSPGFENLRFSARLGRRIGRSRLAPRHRSSRIANRAGTL